MRRHRCVGDVVDAVGLGVEVAAAGDEVADAEALVCEVTVLGV
jgi:hypothetical protein